MASVSSDEHSLAEEEGEAARRRGGEAARRRGGEAARRRGGEAARRRGEAARRLAERYAASSLRASMTSRQGGGFWRVSGKGEREKKRRGKKKKRALISGLTAACLLLWRALSI